MSDVTIEVVHGDALDTASDVLVLKYAQSLFGVDQIAAGKLSAGGHTIEFPEPWHTQLERTRGRLAPPLVLFVGVPPLYQFRYSEIRRFATAALADLAVRVPDARSVSFTLHGAGYGLDEAEAFESQVAGTIDAIHSGAIPDALERVQIVQLDANTVERLREQLRLLLPGGTVARPAAGDAASPSRGPLVGAPAPPPAPLAGRRPFAPATAPREDWLAHAGYDSDAKAHIFVAMPFRESLDDLYHYGIRNATRAAGYVCERADLSTFTGDVMQWVRSRIRSSALVIAEMSDANPNVYLEVGFAWGVGVPTVLLARKDAELQFDVRGQRCLLYSSIRDLEEALTEELKGLPAIRS